MKFSSLENTDVIDAWTKTLNSKATTPDGKAVMGQLSSLVSYYNSVKDQESVDIDWNQWKEQIETEGLVDKIK